MTLKTITLKTTLTFLEYDLRGTSGFPNTDQGFVYLHKEDRVLKCKYTGLPIKRQAEYAVRTDNTGYGWRVDFMPHLGPLETVYGEDGKSYWSTPEEAARALEAHLNRIATNAHV